MFLWSPRWAVTGSNRRPPACKAGALPAELTARAASPQREPLARPEAPKGRVATASILSLPAGHIWDELSRVPAENRLEQAPRLHEQGRCGGAGLDPGALRPEHSEAI